MIELYTSATPNGWKISVALEEMELPYRVHPINLIAGDQKKEEYRKINPNSRIPTIVDTDNNDFAVFESGAILLYLARKSGKLWSGDPNTQSLIEQWLMFQMGGIGPMMGQANVFYRYFPEKIPAAIDRYHSECRRLFEVLDRQLENNEFLAGDYSIADVANWCWARTYKWSGVSIEGLDNLHRWIRTIRARPAVEKGIKVPVDLGNLMETDKSKEADTFAKSAQTILQGVKQPKEQD